MHTHIKPNNNFHTEDIQKEYIFSKTLERGLRIKVLIIIDNLTCGGKERRLISLINELVLVKELSIELALIDGDVFYSNSIPQEIKVHIFNRKIKRDPFIFSKIFNLVRNIRPDIIHSWGSMPTIYSLPAARLNGIKLINAEIANAPLKLNFKSKLRSKVSFKFSDAIVSNSLAGIKAYNSPEDKTICIHNGFNFIRTKCKVSPNEIRNSFGIDTKYLVGMVGKLIPKKDYLTFLISAMEILNSRTDTSFIVVGDGAQLNDFKNLTKDYNRIIFTGAQTDTESIINAFDIGVLTTNAKIHGEGISNSILEYMAFGKPVIATKCGGNSEIVMNNITGFLIDDHDSRGLINRINLLLENTKLSSEMGKNGRRVVEEKFSIEKMVLSTINLYKKVYKNGTSVQLDISSGNANVSNILSLNSSEIQQ